MRILVVDDEPSLLTLIEALLRSQGWDVMLAANGYDALSKIDDNGSPDAVVLDFSMPGMDGGTVFREMRERGVDSPVVLLSAFGARRAQRELGADDFLEKPFDLDVLVERVIRLVDGASNDGDSGA